MPDGGSLKFRSDSVTVDRAFAQRLRRELEVGEYAVIEVIDSGEGISPEVQEKVFEPFFTTKQSAGGTGLGLSTSYESVRRFGGTITVDSVPGKGSTFSIFLPRITSAHTPPVNSFKTAPQPPVWEGARVMVVDDEAPVRRSLEIALSARGYRVESFGRSADALAALAQRSFDVVILDMLMPTMSGREVFDSIQSFPTPPPVIVTTGFSEDEDLKSMRARGLFSVVFKPYVMNHLVAELERARADQGPFRAQE